MSKLISTSLSLMIGLTASAPVFAHAHLKDASPAPESTVQTAPSEVSIDFTEGVEAKFSTIEVKDATGARVDAGDVHTAPDDAKRLSVTLKPLRPGAYTVTWRVTALDTHKSNGAYTFALTK